MRRNSAAILFTVLALACAAGAAAQSIIKDLSVPEFDPAGNLRWRLKAASAVGTLDDPKLNDGQVELFDGQAADAPLVGVLSFKEAIYHRKRAEIEGEQHVRYRAAEGTLDGEGFTYRLTDRHLHINSQVVLQSPSARVTAREADAVLAQNAKDEVIGLTRAKLDGGVAVTRAPDAKYDFDCAETESAVYTDVDGMLTLRSPVTTWKGGDKAVVHGSEIKLFIGALPDLRHDSKPLAPSGAGLLTPQTGTSR